MKLSILFFAFFLFTKELITNPLPFKLPVEFTAYDEYNNEWARLQLLEDERYVYHERFLDGSSLMDSGHWTFVNGKLYLTSSQKTQRSSFAVQGAKKEYKFRSACFEWKQSTHTLQYSHHKGENAYLSEYVWRAKTETDH